MDFVACAAEINLAGATTPRIGTVGRLPMILSGRPRPPGQARDTPVLVAHATVKP